MLGALAVAGFVVVIVGVNLPNPLMPLYTERYGLTPLAQSVLFSLYLLALVATLSMVIRRPSPRLSPRTTLIVALVLSAGTDLLMVWGSQMFAGLAAGRLAAGVSVGLATGSAATVALAALGERARTMVASGAVIGSLAGNLGGGLLGVLTPAPLETVYSVHLLVTLAVATSLLLVRGVPAPSTTAAEPVTGEPSGYRPRHRRAALLLGAMSWSAAGVVLALVPTSLRLALPGVSLLQAVLPGAMFLAAAWAAQTLCRRRILRLRAWQLSVPLVIGMALIAVALDQGRWWLLLAGAVIGGLGQGPAYSLGLATVTFGLRAARQGRAASWYAAVAYGACGVVTTAVGAYALQAGVPAAIATLTAGLAVAGLSAAAFAGAPQRVHLAARPATA
ncbi:MFS transporter [Actinoplanes couchii]|uniref:Major facilitator superfamily MFS_1 n=1 Tax=Actinoplanes couchii TaxID=403638 RepID=A0ABQ3XEW7_9ACTN|nr:MFS transporter [Actinoplanes couchii]MDR6319920.1 putative MFS family arabinose efflux permease [Actinoplanes couchii]GID57057.1 hypothetical protein Aco03nite_054610 [Actinoplanes couchii]